MRIGAMTILRPSKRSRGVLKIVGYGLVVVSLALGWLKHAKLFEDRRKAAFAEIVMNHDEEIPRSTDGFDLFLAAFPPPKGINGQSITAIADRTLRIDSRSDVGDTVAYVASNQRTPVVARFHQVQDWAHASSVGFWTLILGTLGACLAVPIHLHDYRESRKKRPKRVERTATSVSALTRPDL